MNKITSEQVKAAILGHAVGDALGVPVEFASREELDASPVTNMQGFGTYPVPAGAWSDDTSMTLCALEAFTHDDFSLDRVMVNFGKWYYKGEFTPTGVMFDAGTTCSMAIDNYFLNHMDARHCGLMGEHNNGNGSLMRILPFALCRPYNTDLIEAASALTHAHRRSEIACVVYTYIVWELIKNPSKDSVQIALHNAGRRYCNDAGWKHFARLVGIETLSRANIKSSGYVVDTLEAALWCLMTTESYKECVLKAVNLGNDTDTVAAVAGGLAGLLYGYGGIPEEWIDTLLKMEWIEEMCEKAVK